MAENGSPDDLTTLSEFDETVLLQALKTRYNQNKIYTYVGDILIAVNPFRDLPIYGKDVSKQYTFNRKKKSQPPHIYALADLAYQSMLGRRGLLPANQCILISGESGAGKTESTKFLLRQLMELCNGNTQLEQQILQVTPLLEAFGNAQTLMNDNSSRFGKYIELKFHKGQVLGAKISEYLLEKSRLVYQDEGEENFHIFYYLFAGESDQSLNQLHLSPRKKYRYLVKGITPEGVPQARTKYADLINAFNLVGFTDEEQANAITLLAGILHLGEVLFTPDQSEAATITQTESAEAITNACRLLGIDEVEVGQCLTSSVTYTRGDCVERKYTIHQANDARDAMAKALYGRLFGWIVNKVNNLVAPKILVPAEETQEIGILDIFGFEHFEHNSFEQACINLANEQLQLFFNQYVFKQEQEEYISEGIDWTEVKFADNKHLLDLFLDKPIGILSLLDEECTFPTGSDKSFVEKLNSNFIHLPYYNRNKRTDILFNISHYAGKVTYDGTSWLEKNRDTFPADIMNALLHSKNKLIKHVFGAKITRTGSLAFGTGRTTRKRTSRRLEAPRLSNTTRHKVTVGGQFRNSLLKLMEKMKAASPVFVRCLKPNQEKVANQFDSHYMLSQLLYTGMLETVKIRRNGFAVRASYEEFVQKYELLLLTPNLPATAESCHRILSSSHISGGYVGKTKVFLKVQHVELLADKMSQLDKTAIHIQKVVRGHRGRKKADKLKEEARKRAQEVAEMCRHVETLGQSFTNQQQSLCQADKDAAQESVRKNSKLLSPKLPSPTLPSPTKSPPPEPHRMIFSPPISGHTSVKRQFGFNGSIKNPQQKPEFENNSTMGSEASFDEDSNYDDTYASEDSDSTSADEYPIPLEPNYESIPSWFKETQTQYLLEVTGEFPHWFHGMIPRRLAEQLLMKSQNRIGCFLVRVSQTKFSYCLSFKGEDRCRHYMIEQLLNEKFYIVGEDKVHFSLTGLVKYYQTNKISNWNGFLSDGIGQEPGSNDYENLIDKRAISLLLQKLKTRPNNIRRLPNEDTDGYMVPLIRPASQRPSYLTLIDSESDSDSESPEHPPPIPNRPIQFKQTALPQPPTQDNPRVSARSFQTRSNIVTSLSRILERPNEN